MIIYLISFEYILCQLCQILVKSVKLGYSLGNLSRSYRIYHNVKKSWGKQWDKRPWQNWYSTLLRKFGHSSHSVQYFKQSWLNFVVSHSSTFIKSFEVHKGQCVRSKSLDGKEIRGLLNIFQKDCKLSSLKKSLSIHYSLWI